MQLQELLDKAKYTQELYEKRNPAMGRKNWTVSDYMSGFTGDVGELSKLIMAKNNLREFDNLDERLKHEVADCLWSILVIANNLNIDLEGAYNQLITDLEKRIAVGK